VSRARIYYMNTGPWPYYIGFTTDPDAFTREMKRLKVDDGETFIKNAHSNATTHFLNNHGSCLAIICVQPFKRSVTREQYAGLLAHEATHVIQDMRENLGPLGSEAEAYLVQQMVQEGLQIAWKTGKVARKVPVP
jgi:hypothetical protein